MRCAPILSFTGDYRWLSNFWPAEVKLTLGSIESTPDVQEIVYPSVENAYQAAKAPSSWRHRFAGVPAGVAKRMGREVPMRADWDDLKVEVMRHLIGQKFAEGSPLSGLLLATGEAEIIEGNHWNDVFWGVCRGRGLNTMGKLLMEQRARLRQGQA